MKKSKLKLSELKLKSFVTDLNAKEEKAINGGNLTGPEICTFPESERLCHSDYICYQTDPRQC